MEVEKVEEIFGMFNNWFDIEGIPKIERWHLLLSMTLACNKGATIGYVKDLIKKEERLK